jgi:hypothetical protein
MKEIGFENECTCPFCGQVTVAGDSCNCDGAKRQKKIADQIFNAHLAIKEVFGDPDDENSTSIGRESIFMLNEVAGLIANYKIHSASFVLPGQVRATLKRGSKGAIKVERSESRKMVKEVKE